jgi:dienelactone hydrolase
MQPDQRAAVLAAMKLTAELPEHELSVDGMPFVSGAVRRQRVSYTVAGGKRLSCWMLHPNQGTGPWPGIIALHPHGDAFGQGGDEVAGQRGLREHHYGYNLAARGFTVFCPDMPCFGQQQAPAGMPADRFWEQLCLSNSLAHGRSLLAETIDQLMGAVAALLDCERTKDLAISVVGYGMGARTAAWLAFADKRVGSIWMHAGLGQQKILMQNGRLLPRHNLLPGILAMGLDQADIVADILPRNLGISYGKADRVAIAEAVAPVLSAVRERQHLFPQANVAIVEGNYDHRFPPDVLQTIGDYLLKWSA